MMSPTRRAVWQTASKDQSPETAKSLWVVAIRGAWQRGGLCVLTQWSLESLKRGHILKITCSCVEAVEAECPRGGR